MCKKLSEQLNIIPFYIFPLFDTTQKLIFASCTRKITKTKENEASWLFLLVTAGGLEKVSHSWWSQIRAVKSGSWSHYRACFLPNIGFGLNPTTH